MNGTKIGAFASACGMGLPKSVVDFWAARRYLMCMTKKDVHQRFVEKLWAELESLTAATCIPSVSRVY